MWFILSRTYKLIRYVGQYAKYRAIKSVRRFWRGIVLPYLLYAENGNIILQATKRTQLIAPDIKGITGAIGGSFPFYQGYVPYGYPNWAAKFFADAIMMKTNYQNNFKVPA